MATVTGITAEKAQEIEDAGIASATVNGSGDLILTRFDGTTINAGPVSTIAAFNAHVGDQTDVHGVGTIVGRTEIQTITNKTFIEPFIASLINAQHDHSTGAAGGALNIGKADSPAPVTSLTQQNLADGDPAKNLATLNVTAGRWLIIAMCAGVTLGSATTSRFKFNITSSAGTLSTSPVNSSSATTAIDGGRAILAWLDTPSVGATVTFTIEKNGTGALITNAANGLFMAIRMG